MRLILLLLLSTLGAFAQNNIQGKIFTKDGQAAEFVNVQLKGSKKVTQSNLNGDFIFKNIPNGKYELEVSMIGFETIKKNIVIENKSVFLPIEIQASMVQLEEVIVTSGGNRFAKKESDDVSKMSLKNLENPQVYSIVSKELMKEQLVTDYNSAFKNIPGAGIPIVYNQGRSAANSRGFTTANLVRNGVGGFVYSTVDPANLERIEVIKGPSATLFGSTLSSFGGLYNRVTKKPFESFKGELSYSGGSWDLNRITLDINTPVNEKKTALFRFNGAIHNERSFQDAGFSKNYLIAPSFSYKVNERLSLMLDMEMSSYNATSPMRYNPLVNGKIRSITELGLPYNLSFANNTIDYTSEQINIFGQMRYKLSDKWTSQTVFSRTRSNSEGYTTAITQLTETTLRQQVTSQSYPYYGTNVQQNFIGDFSIGNFRNRLVLGVDYYNLQSSRNDATVNMPALNFKKPGTAYNNFNVEKVSPLFATATFINQVSNREETISGYFSDIINLTDKLLVMGSLRVDNYKNKGVYFPNTDSTAGAYKQTALSPKLGLVYQLIKDNVSFFANYMNGFNNVSGADFNGNTFKPQQANQWETGFKFDILANKLNATISYYDISVTNMTMTDPNHANFSLQDGTQLSKGYEIELIANPTRGLNIVAGYTHNDSQFDKANENIQGLRPVEAGPETTANFWLSYRIFEGKIKGLGLGFGGNYGSSSFQTNTKTFAFTIPSYTVLDAAIFYDQPVYRLGIKLSNLTDEKYWSTRLQAQKPINLTFSATFKI
jgi:iron complex outermembrane receptor protein